MTKIKPNIRSHPTASTQKASSIETARVAEKKKRRRTKRNDAQTRKIIRKVKVGRQLIKMIAKRRKLTRQPKA